jgi:hypothetical protein
MGEIFKKLSSYNIFNYLLPGVIFAIFTQKFTEYNLIQSDVIVGLFLYYFIGLIISRIGSLVFEPFLKWIKLLNLSKYRDYAIASKNDDKIEILLEQNNIYRAFISMLSLFLLLKMYESIRGSYVFLVNWDRYILIVGILLLFLSAYKKQTNYITKRINLKKK